MVELKKKTAKIYSCPQEGKELEGIHSFPALLEGSKDPLGESSTVGRVGRGKVSSYILRSQTSACVSFRK